MDTAAETEEGEPRRYSVNTAEEAVINDKPDRRLSVKCNSARPHSGNNGEAAGRSVRCLSSDRLLNDRCRNGNGAARRSISSVFNSNDRSGNR